MIIVSGIVAFVLLMLLTEWLEKKRSKKEDAAIASFISSELPSKTFIIDGMVYKMEQSEIIFKGRLSGKQALICRTQKGNWFLLNITPSPGKLFSFAVDINIEKCSFTDKKLHGYLLEHGESALAEKYFGRPEEA